MAGEIDWSKVGNTDPNTYLKSTIPAPQMPRGMASKDWTDWCDKMARARRIRDGEEDA